MSAYLTNKAHILISTAATPTQAEIAAQLAPQAMKPSFDSLATEDSGRSDDGVMHIYWVKNRYRKFDITLKPDTPENISKVLNLVMGKIYYLTYWDILTNTEKTTKVYTSNASTEWYSGIVMNGLLQNVTFSAIDMEGENT